jgi:hypothetical protein
MKVLKFFESVKATGPNVFDAVELLQTLVASKHEVATSSKNHLENWKIKSVVHEELDEILLSHEQERTDHFQRSGFKKHFCAQLSFVREHGRSH